MHMRLSNRFAQVREAVLWDEARSHEEVHHAAHMLASCHLAAAALWPGLLPKAAKRPALSPDAMRRCVAVFCRLARALRQHEAERASELQRALARFHDVQVRMEEYTAHLVTLEPRIRAQRELLDEQRTLLHALKEAYMLSLIHI